MNSVSGLRRIGEIFNFSCQVCYSRSLEIDILVSFSESGSIIAFKMYLMFLKM